MGNFSSVQLRRSVRAVTGKKTWIFSYSGDCTRNMHCVVVSIIPRLHDRADIEQAWWNPAPWLKRRPRLSAQLIASLPIATCSPS